MTRHSLVAADRLPACDEDGNHLAVIEASAESRSKFKFEPDYGAFLLHSVLPTGTSFPYAFGFIPSTLGDDGDPLDVIVLSDEPPPVGTIVPARVIAILEAEQSEKGDEGGKGGKIRNDRVLAVAARSERFASWHKRSDVDKSILERIAKFFQFYHAEQGKEFKPLRWKSAPTALALIKKGRRRFARKHPG